MSRKIIAGNWKMNHNLIEGLNLIQNVHEFFSTSNKKFDHVEVVIAPPFLHVSQAAIITKSINVSIAGQDCSQHDSGAYTGEISAAMLKSAGAELVIIGHSERRQYHNESDEQMKAKLKQAWKNNLLPIFCVGEHLEQRQNKEHFETIRLQLDGVLSDFSSDQLENLIIAYEPVWAIGTGEVASSAQAQEMHQFIRKHIANKYDAMVASEISILYGGSLKPANAKEIFSQPDVDGGLIGGASLKLDSFAELISIGEDILR